MPRRVSILLLCVAAAVSFVNGCGNDSTSPKDEGPPAFSRMVFGDGTDFTLMGDVVVTSDGRRVMVGTCGSSLQVTGSSTSLDPAGTSRVFLVRFNPDGTLASSTLVPGGGTPPTIHAMARDSSNNLLVVGSFLNDVTLGTTGLTSAGRIDMFMTKLDASGHPVWVQAAQGTGLDDGLDIAVAPDGSVCVAGYCDGEIDLAGVTVGTAGKSSGFLAKLSPGGAGVWQKTVVPTTLSIARGTAVSQDGSVLVCGGYEGASVTIGGVTLPNDGLANAYISRFSSDGAGMGNIRIGGTGTAVARQVTTIGDEPLVAGTFTGTTDFDVNTSAGSIAAVGIDAFIARYSKAGELRWVVTMGGADDQLVSGLSRLGSGDIVACGTFSTVVTVGSKSLDAVGSTDAYFVRVSGDGEVLSADRVGGSNEEEAAGITTSNGIVVVVGTTKSNDTAFPDGSQRPLSGSIESFIYQQP